MTTYFETFLLYLRIITVTNTDTQMIIIEGKNPEFFAVWCCDTQCYTVYYKNQVLIKKDRFSDIKSYLL